MRHREFELTVGNKVHRLRLPVDAFVGDHVIHKAIDYHAYAEAKGQGWTISNLHTGECIATCFQRRRYALECVRSKLKAELLKRGFVRPVGHSFVHEHGGAYPSEVQDAWKANIPFRKVFAERVAVYRRGRGHP